jgi:uncharacterized protein YfaS (alpha-2-macroglobulin family)
VCFPPRSSPAGRITGRPVTRGRGFGARLALLAAAATMLVWPALLAAQSPADERPAFSLASGAIGSSKDQPSIFLTFRRVSYLDFRVYRVNDPLAFIAGLKDPHQLGSEEPLVDQEPTWLERIANWKASRREAIRDFLRRQFSYEYRRARRHQQDRQQVALRRTEHVNGFAQVPYLNASQVVTTWRERLPPVRDAEYRRIPLELTKPGMYVVEAVNAPLKAYTIVIVSDVGVVSKAAPGQVLLYAANRSSGTPMAQCGVRVIGDQRVVADGATGSDGVFMADLGKTRAEDVVAVTRCGEQVAATDPGGWFLRAKARGLVAYIYTDKPIYRPGHTVHLKAILRWREADALLPFDRRQVEVRITDPTNKVVARQTASVDAYGSVGLTWPVPDGAALGAYAATIVSGEDEAASSFEVQEYRKPEYEVRVTPAQRFVVQGSAAVATIDARYYFGQPVARGKVHYVVHRQPYYSPLRWSDDEEPGEGGWWYAGDQILEGDARLSESGTVEISIPSPVDEEGRDYSLRIEARVTDAGGREVAGNSIVHGTYGPFMVVAGTDEYVKRPGSQATLSVRTIDYSGTPVAGRAVNVWLESRTAGTWRDASSVVVLARGVVTTDAEGRASWTTTMPSPPGDYRFRAAVTVDGRALQDEAYVWVPGNLTRGEELDYGDRYLELVADRRTYAPGDTAHLLVRGEEFDAPVLITKEGQQVSWHAVVQARGNAAIDVPITDADVGDTWVNIAFLRGDRLYRAEKRVRVPAVSRQLQLTVTASQAVARPRQPATFVVTAADADGRPVRAQVSVGVIDEAVYGVKADDTPDPLRFFYRRDYSSVGTSFSREYSFIGYSGTQELTLARLHRPPTGLADFKGDRARPQVRKDFPDAIFWVADLTTDANGRTEVQVRYPDALTTWRLTARAVTEDTRVGVAIARTTTTKDLIVRSITPRFLSQHDELTVPIVVHNYLPEEQEVQVGLEAQGVQSAAAPSALTAISIPSGGERRLDTWRFRADDVGKAVFTATATTAGESDAVEISLPVLPFGLKNEASQAGSILGAGDRTISLTVPPDANPSARTIRVTLAPSLAGSMLGALDFLTSYPYGCTEQILSSFVPTLVVSRTLASLGLAPTERLKALDRQVTAGVDRLLEQQHDDGGWGWWKTDENHPFMTAYAVYGLAEARRAGYTVDEWKIRQGATRLSALYAKYPRMTPALKAYVVYVMLRADGVLSGIASAGGFDAAAALDELWGRRDDLTPYGRALLLQSLDMRTDARGDTLAQQLVNEATRTGEIAFWKSDNDPLLDDWGDTSVEATAAALQALAPREPQNPLLEAAVRYLVANRTGSYWGTTKQTAMALYGLIDFLKARKESPAAFPVDVTVNGQHAGTVTFTPESLTDPEPKVVTVAAQAGTNSVSIAKRGDAGALYWSASAVYYDTRTPIERTGSRHLALVRRYFSLVPATVAGRTVYREVPFGGTARPGDVILVRISAAGSTDWRYLMIEDPLPAGTEPIADDELYELERRSPGSAWWLGRRELRDDRAVFFRERLPDGRTDLHYLLEVTTPGRFQAMPARITPMYVPGTSASSDVQTVVVETAADGGTP